MSKNPNGFTKTNGSKEWGRKARKEEDHMRGARSRSTAEAVATGLDEIFAEALEDEAQDWYAEAFLAQWDDDPSPYGGTYSED